MKKITTALFVLLFIMICTIQAQVKENVIKTSLSAPIIRTFTLAYERALNPDMSLQLGGSYFAGWSIGDTRLDGFSVLPEFRYYLSEEKECPNGGFIAPFLRYGSIGIEVGDEGTPDYGKASLTNYGGGVLVGVQRLFKETISLEAFIGPAYYNVNVQVEEGTEEEFSTGLLEGFSVRLGVTLGIAF